MEPEPEAPSKPEELMNDKACDASFRQRQIKTATLRRVEYMFNLSVWRSIDRQGQVPLIWVTSEGRSSR